MKNKNLYSFLSLTIVFAMLGMVLIVPGLHVAKADDNGNDAMMSVSHNGEQGDENALSPHVVINSDGTIIVNGASYVSTTNQTIVVKVFGLNLNVNTTSSTQFLGFMAGTTNPLSQIVAGDTVDVKGTIDSSSGVITATWVRDETQQQKNIQSLQQQINALLEQLKNLEAQIRAQGGGSENH